VVIHREPHFASAHRAVTEVCHLPVDLTPLKLFDEKQGKEGRYCETNFQIVVNFDLEIMYALVKGKEILGSISTGNV